MQVPTEWNRRIVNICGKVLRLTLFNIGIKNAEILGRKREKEKESCILLR